jgi:gamma-glutamylcyclotransferase (GGCT)/AIG2-like uncharacterized protein YtfP
MLYAAYGANTNLTNMASRCPNAELLGPAKLLNFELRFRGHADVQFQAGSNMEVVLWNITEDCLQSLDAFEGYPSYYNCIHAVVEYQGEILIALVYIMNDQEYESRPGDGYFDMCSEGYRENGLNTNQLHEARERIYFRK